MQVTTLTPSLKNNMIKIYTLGGGRSYKMVVPGKLEVSASFEYNIQNGQFFKYALGTVSAGAASCVKNFDAATITGTPTAALKSYACTEADVLDSFSSKVYMISDATTADQVDTYVGCKVNQLNIKSDAENPLKGSVDILAQTVSSVMGTQAAPTTVAYKDIPSMFYNGQLLIGAGYRGTGTGTASTMTDSLGTGTGWTTSQWITDYVLIDITGVAFAISASTAAGVLTVTGTPATGEYVITPKSSLTTAQVIQCNSVDQTITQNLEAYWAIANTTGRGMRFAYEKMREYSLSLDLNFTNADQLGRFYNGLTSGTSPATTTPYPPFMVVVDYKTALADGDAYKAMRLVYSDVVFDESSVPVDPKDIIKQTVKAFAKHLNVYFITSEVQ
jgi:hypothetical protein